MELGRTRRLRWALPAGAVIAVAALIAGTEAATAQPSPALPSRTAAQLVAAVAAARGPVPLTGTYTETANLGVPSLPGGSDPLSGLALLAGTHTFQIWAGDAQELRIAEPVQLGEADVRRFGNQIWVWDSRTQRATNIILPATITPPGGQPGSSSSSSISSSPASVSPGPGPVPPAPQQLGRRILTAIGPTTVVSVRDNVTVAGQPAYQLALAPKDSRSLIGQVTIAIDARHALPLRVQVFARGASRPALQAGYTALSFGAPAASNFTFTPPPGAKVKTINVPAPPSRPQFRGGRGGPSAPGMSAGPGPSRNVRIDPATGRPEPGSGMSGEPGQHPTVAGTGWLSVLVVPPSAAATAAQTPVPVYDDGGHVVAYASAVATVPTATPFSAAGPAADPAVLAALLKAATPVHGAWGSGRLLRTSLLSVLFTDQGTVLAGAVTPAVLYADAAAVK
jgi:outer membrane lipoprotein-sorting protein